jgi:hypothetical protein
MMGRAFMLGSAAVVLACTPAVAQRSIDLSLHGLGVFSRRSAAFDGGAGSGSGRLAGGELLARARLWGVSLRWVGGEFEADSGNAAVGSVAEGEIDLALGPRAFGGIFGYGRRSYTGAVGTRRWSLLRVGAATQLPLGTSGFRAEARALRALTLGGEAGGSGTIVETRLAYAPSHLPLSIAVGYRASSFSSEATTGTRPEDVTGPLIAIGVRWP